jgi:tRNA U54 and U55 pseudouridine synthase Pus10
MSLEKKIYREWAFTGNESEKASINREIYKELCEKYKISRYEVENPDDYDIVLKRTAGYNHSTYAVIKNNTNLSQLERIQWESQRTKRAFNFITII